MNYSLRVQLILVSIYGQLEQIIVFNNILFFLLINHASIIIIIIIIITTTTTTTTTVEFFTSALADGFSLEFEWQQVTSSLLDTSLYSGRFQ